MRITVLWEDQRGVITRGFGPHDLLVSCVADELRCARDAIKRHIDSVPKKGNRNVVKALKQDLDKLSRGPVCAVIDRDKILDLWPAAQRPPGCLTGISGALHREAQGSYELILLIDNVETLVAACCHALGISEPASKPSPDERDRLLQRVAWGDTSARRAVREAVPSFDRLVKWTAKSVPRARS
jgi:hypothetical protein